MEKITTIIDCYNEEGIKVAVILPDSLSWQDLRDALLAQEYQNRTTIKKEVTNEFPKGK